MATLTIGELSGTAELRNVYIRHTGEIFIKLNERFHVKTKLNDDNTIWLGDGVAEEFDPSEKVNVVQ